MVAPLNFAAQAARDLRRLTDAKLWPDQSTLKVVASIIEKSVHFQLPDGGRLFDDGLKGIRGSSIHLPYPSITVEYVVPVEMHRLTESTPYVCTKRMALAIEVKREELKEFVAHLDAHERKDFDDGAIQVIVVDQLGDAGIWIPLELGFIMPCQWDRDPSRTDGEPRIVGYPYPVLVGRLEILLEHMERKEQDRETTKSQMVQDLWDEVCAVLSLIEALSCSNVRADSIQRLDAQLNARRAKDGKLPLYEVKVLTIETPNLASTKSRLGGHHASPRQHLRRGHVRRLKDRNVWVNSAVVGDPKKGRIIKSYNLRRA